MKTPKSGTQSALRQSNLAGTVTHMGEARRAKVKDEKCETLPRTQFQTAFIREDSSDASDISVEDGARILLDFIASAWAAHETPSP